MTGVQTCALPICLYYSQGSPETAIKPGTLVRDADLDAACLDFGTSKSKKGLFFNAIPVPWTQGSYSGERQNVLTNIGSVVGVYKSAEGAGNLLAGNQFQRFIGYGKDAEGRSKDGVGLRFPLVKNNVPGDLKYGSVWTGQTQNAPDKARWNGLWQVVAANPSAATLRSYGVGMGNIDNTDEAVSSGGQKIAELKAQMQTLYAAAKEAAEKLTQSRLKGFAAMNKEMKAALEFLNMPGIRFALKHARGPLSSHGQDTVEFLISTNPGEEPKPLAKIASGGELSRIMLAFKSALADRDALPTVIYDEIDTGVSGLAAGRIGQLLHQTARGHQVLCITHTPQVAAFADNQLLIQKNVRKDRTFTEIHTLDMDGRVEVLARMISGDKVSELSLASARELIEKSK